MRSLLIAMFIISRVDDTISQNLQDTSFVRSGFENSITLYKKAIEGQEAFYTGSQYAEPEQTEDGDHPFFNSDDWTFGSVTFDGQVFGNVPLLYDITSDYVVSESPSGGMYTIADHNLTSFTISDHHFEKLDGKQARIGSLKPGYYEIVYEGFTKVICRHEKNPQQSYEDRKVLVHFKEKSKYFIQQNGTFHTIGSKSSVLKILSDKKNLLRSYIHSKGLNFSKARNKAIAEIAAYYDQLNREEK